MSDATTFDPFRCPCTSDDDEARLFFVSELDRPTVDCLDCGASFEFAGTAWRRRTEPFFRESGLGGSLRALVSKPVGDASGFAYLVDPSTYTAANGYDLRPPPKDPTRGALLLVFVDGEAEEPEVEIEIVEPTWALVLRRAEKLARRYLGGEDEAVAYGSTLSVVLSEEAAREVVRVSLATSAEFEEYREAALERGSGSVRALRLWMKSPERLPDFLRLVDRNRLRYVVEGDALRISAFLSLAGVEL